VSVARDFDDIERDYGADAVRDALDNARFVGRNDHSPINAEDQDQRNFTATPFVYRDPATIPRRQFLYGFELRRRQVSAVVAPGAAGKTTLKVGRAICMATGKDMLGHRVWNGPHRVWLWNLEDDLEEVEKTVHAFLKLWELDPDDLGGRLFINGADSIGANGLKLAVEDNFGSFKLQRPVAEAVIAELKERKIDYLDIDPFVSSHAVDENSNQAIDAVAKEWLRIAHETNSAIGLAHHLRKSTAAEFTALDARGAGAMINAARSCLVLQRMSKEAAEEFGIEACDRKSYFSVYDDKNNKAPPALNAEWYEFVSVGLGNADVGSEGPEDSIGAVQRWQAPDSFGGVTTRQLYNIQRMIDDNPMKARKHSKAREWVGKIVAHVLDRNLDDQGEARRIETMIRTWLSNGALKTIEKMDETRQPREFVEVGRWAEIS
jgi:hypothetical protein